MKQIVKLYCLICCICACCSCTYNIKDLDNQKVHFDELPLLVQDTLIVLSEQGNRSLDFILLEKESRYDTKMIESGPFISGYVLTDNEKGKKYKINNGVPKPYIVYNNFLYHPLEFNVLFINRIKNEVFVKYELN